MFLRKGEKRVNQTEGFRHEMKYRIGYAQYIEMRNRLRTVMQSDMHTGTDGKYLIRSIYFDNYADKALREKTDGVPVREKFRIRYYNDDFSYLTLEKKIKDNDLCMKIDARITEKECGKILDGRTTWMMEHSSPLVRELYAKMRYRCFARECLYHTCVSLIFTGREMYGLLLIRISERPYSTGIFWKRRSQILIRRRSRGI